MHSGELWQEFDKNGNRLGGINSAEYDSEKIQLFGGVAIMLYRFENGKVEFLFQHRSKNLDRNADKWDVSAGGHINFEEKEIDSAVRETKEEIGIDLDPKQLEFSATYARDGKTIINLYFYDWTGKTDEFHFNDEEVSEVKWVPFEELVEFWPNLKPQVTDDAIFQNQLLEWTRITRKKHEHIDK